MYLLLQDEHIIVLCFYFSCWLWNVFFVEMEIILYEKYLRLEENEQLLFFKINACELYDRCQVFGCGFYRIHGKNFRNE